MRRLETDIPKWKWESIDDLHSGLSSAFAHILAKGCPCQFPRFRQFVSIDCLNTGGSFYCYESNRLILIALQHGFNINSVEKTEDRNSQIICSVCSSIYQIDSDEFGMGYHRLVLKLEKKNCVDIGAGPLKEIPIFIGPLGYHWNSAINFKESPIDEIVAYLIA